MKKVLIINAHPNKGSLCAALAAAYKTGADAAGAECRSIDLVDLSFDPIMRGFQTPQELEPDLVRAQGDISWAEHIVFVYPTWWGTYPALLKGFFDRVFLPHFAFRYHDGKPLPEKLLTGRTARIITTMDTPWWYYALVYRSVGIRAVKTSVLNFCGIHPVKVSYFRPVISSTKEQREQWLTHVEQMGREQL